MASAKTNEKMKRTLTQLHMKMILKICFQTLVNAAILFPECQTLMKSLKGTKSLKSLKARKLEKSPSKVRRKVKNRVFVILKV